MSQQNPQFQQGTQFEQRQFDNQQTSDQGMGGQGMQTQGRLPVHERSALSNVAQAIEVCEWCADQCVQEADPNMIECIRLCEDVAELGETVLALAPRNSRYTQSVLQAFQQAIQACAQECGRHQAMHCQECAQVLSQVTRATQQLQQQPQMATQ